MRLTWPSDADASSEKSIEPHRSLHSDSDSELGVSALALQEAQCDRLLRGWDKAWCAFLMHCSKHGLADNCFPNYSSGCQDALRFGLPRPADRKSPS